MASYVNISAGLTNEFKGFVQSGEEVSLIRVWNPDLHLAELGLEWAGAVEGYVQYCSHAKSLQDREVGRVSSTAEDKMRQYLYRRSVAVAVVNWSRLQPQLSLATGLQGYGEADTD